MDNNESPACVLSFPSNVSPPVFCSQLLVEGHHQQRAAPVKTHKGIFGDPPLQLSHSLSCCSSASAVIFPSAAAVPAACLSLHICRLVIASTLSGTVVVCLTRMSGRCLLLLCVTRGPSR